MTEQPPTLRQEIETICFKDGGYPEKWPRHSECPACGRHPIITDFYKYGFSHARCISCGFVAVDPFPPEEIMTKLYTGSYYTNIREHFEKPMLLRNEEMPFSAPRDLLERLIERTHEGREVGRWLDVGGGLGAFTHLVRQTLPGWSVALNEINPQSVAIAREILNLDVVDLEPEALNASGQKYDAISYISVIEHIPRPANFLKRYVNLLNRNGKLIIVVPHFTHLNSCVSKGSNANVVPPYHVSLFNEQSLKLLIGQIPNLQLEALEQAGPAAFNLFDHVQFGDHWDISTPTAAHPEPRSVKIRQYDKEMNDALNALGEINDRLKDYFAETDGRLYLVAYCKLREDY